MRGIRSLAISVLAGAAVAGTAEEALAQAGLSIRAARRDTVTARATVSASFLIVNSRPDSAAVRTRLELPAEWTPLTGAGPIAVPPGSAEMLILSVVVPGRALAGLYAIRVWVTSAADPRGAFDSVVVRVPERNATELTLLDRPGYVVSGRSYQPGFEIRNRGNLAGTVRLAARGSVGDARLSDTLLHLEPGESRVVRARVLTPAGLAAAVDDVVELVAHRVGQDHEPVRASSRVTVVPEPNRNIEHYLRIPTRVNLRAVTTTGVSPFEILGQGLVRDGGSTLLDFAFRGPTGPTAAFGERDEYRLELRSRNWRARAGDHVFALSPLTGSGQPGVGLGAGATRGRLSVGGHTQHFRRVPQKGDESGAFLAVTPTSASRIALHAVSRVGGALPGTVASGLASLQLSRAAGSVELARSRRGPASGDARNVRLSGQTGSLALDAGHQYADTGFTGSQRGAEHNFVMGNLAASELMTFGFNASRHRADLSRSTGVPYRELFRTGALSAALLGRYTIELGSVERDTDIQSFRRQERQWGLRGRADHDFSLATLSLEIEGGRSRTDADTRRFSDLTIGARRDHPWGYSSVYAQRYSGGAVTKGSSGSRTVGGDASVRIGRMANATLIGYATKQETPAAEWHSQLDVLIARSLSNGSSIGLRARLLTGGTRASSQRSVMFLEYGLPVRLPVSRLRTTGRVTGRVVDAVSGNGVSGALVRLGPQVAITDRNGEVSFGGVPAGAHRLSMSQETSFASAVFMGDPTVHVDGTRVSPTTFALAIAPGARLDVDVRRFAQVRTATDDSGSLRDAGGLSNATLMLVAGRDTLYRSTDDNGKAAFTDLPPGQWVLTISGDTPAFTRFDPDRVELLLEPGETKSVAFRLLPRRREIQMIGDGEELRPAAADPKAPAQAGSAPRPAKPGERRP